MTASSSAGLPRALVLGGAGFVGSHLVDALIERGHPVRVLDLLVPQVHGDDVSASGSPRHLHPGAEFIQADIADAAALRRALDGVEVVFHDAAEVGVAQSMYQVTRYARANTLGTAVLLDLLIEDRGSVCKLVVASSMSIYGEGTYMCPEHGAFGGSLRSDAQLKAGEWEMRCPICGRSSQGAPTSEDQALAPTSIYAITKRDQDEMCLTIGRAYGIPTVALRYFNIYGPRQSLNNPYTGIAAIFSSRLLNDRAPTIFEDGEQSRDFVHVSDIVQANLLAIERDTADYQAVNVGTGVSTSVRRVAETIAEGLDKDIQPDIVHSFRAGDIRHCVADIERARRLLGYEPRVSFRDGMRDLLAWVRTEQAEDHADHALAELVGRGLTAV